MSSWTHASVTREQTHEPSGSDKKRKRFARSANFQEDSRLSSKVLRRFLKHPGAVAGSIVLAILILAVLLGSFSPYSSVNSNVLERLQPPSFQHPMGTDALGRDLLTRILFGGRISLTVGLMVVVDHFSNWRYSGRSGRLCRRLDRQCSDAHHRRRPDLAVPYGLDPFECHLA